MGKKGLEEKIRSRLVRKTGGMIDLVKGGNTKKKELSLRKERTRDMRIQSWGIPRRVVLYQGEK